MEATPAAKTLLVVLSDIRPELEADYLRWYDEEHIPQRLAVPGFLGAARYAAGPAVRRWAWSRPYFLRKRCKAMRETDTPQVRRMKSSSS